MPSSLAIKVDVEKLLQSQGKSQTVTGEIFCVAGGVSFPEAGWNDFVIIILTWWLEACTRLGRGQSQEVWRFMDGPWQVDLQRLGEDVSFRFEDCHQAEATVFGSGVVPLAHLNQELRGVVRRVLDHCQSHGIAGTDVESLARAFHAHVSMLQ